MFVGKNEKKPRFQKNEILEKKKPEIYVKNRDVPPLNELEKHFFKLWFDLLNSNLELLTTIAETSVRINESYELKEKINMKINLVF